MRIIVRCKSNSRPLADSPSRTERNRDFRLGIQSQSLSVFSSAATRHLANPLIRVYFGRGEPNRMRNASGECRRGAGGDVEDSLERARASSFMVMARPRGANRVCRRVDSAARPPAPPRNPAAEFLLQFHLSVDNKYLTYSAHDQLRQAHIIRRLESFVSVNNDSINSPFKSRAEKVLLLDNNERSILKSDRSHELSMRGSQSDRVVETVEPTF